MNNFLKFSKNRTLSLIISIVIFFILTLLVRYTRALDGIENGAINFRFYLRAPEEKSKKLEGGKLYTPNPKANIPDCMKLNHIFCTAP